MAQLARDAMDVPNVKAVADRGYFNSDEVRRCVEEGIDVIVPKPGTSNAAADGRFAKHDFSYRSDVDEYRCPAGRALTHRFTTVEKGLTLHTYIGIASQGCTIKSQCTTGKERRLKRWEHEAILDAMQAKLDQNPEMMRLRRQTVEHPFGTIKSWMGATHFLTRGLERVSTEMSLHVLAYNLKRMMKLMGIKPLIQAMRT